MRTAPVNRLATLCELRLAGTTCAEISHGEIRCAKLCDRARDPGSRAVLIGEAGWNLEHLFNESEDWRRLYAYPMIKNGNSARAMEAGTIADVVIRPQISGLKATDFQDRHMALLEGEKAVAAVLPQIKAKLAPLRESR